MAVYEALTLDGLTISGDPTATLILEQFSAPPPKAKPEWIGAADSEWSALARSPLHENREITLRVRVKQQASMNLALDQIGSVRDKLRKASLTDSGIVLAWTPASSTRTVNFDVLHGEITDLPIEPNGDGYGWFLSTPVVTVVLTAKPYWYGTEVTTSTATSSAPLMTLEVASVPGDIPALGRLIVTEAASQNRRFIEWGIEGQNYTSPGTSQPLVIDSDSMVVTGFAGTQVTAGSMYDPNATGTNAIRVQPLISPLAIAGTGTQSHVGTFRVWGKFASSAANGTHRGRFVWRVGDSQYTANSWVLLDQAPAHQEVDLGLITIPVATAGTQRWDGRVEAYDDTGDANVSPTNLDLDFLTMIPAAEGYGYARSTYRYEAGVVVARDDFTGTTAGALLGTRAAPLGGSWASAGATTDFNFSDAGAGAPAGTQERMERSTVSDASTTLGRYAVLGTTNYTDTEVGARIYRTNGLAVATGVQQGVIARFVDSSNYVLFRLQPYPASLSLIAIVAGVTNMSRQTFTVPTVFWDTWYRLRLVVFATGYAVGSLLDDNANEIVNVQLRTTALATGGALASGKPGVMDINPSATAGTRLYDTFYAATPPSEPIALYSGRTLEIRHDITTRQDSGGTYYGRPQSYRGSRFLVPTGTSRVAVKARRNDILTQDATTVTDSTTIQVAYTPRGLVAPR